MPLAAHSVGSAPSCLSAWTHGPSRLETGCPGSTSITCPRKQVSIFSGASARTVTHCAAGHSWRKRGLKLSAWVFDGLAGPDEVQREAALDGPDCPGFL